MASDPDQILELTMPQKLKDAIDSLARATRHKSVDEILSANTIERQVERVVWFWWVRD